jgi:hypothetical protein
MDMERYLIAIPASDTTVTGKRDHDRKHDDRSSPSDTHGVVDHQSNHRRNQSGQNGPNES